MKRRCQLGDAQSAQDAQIAGSIAASGVSAAAATGLIAASAAGPIGAGIALAAIAISQLIANSGCGPTCIIATNYVNQLEPQLAANRDAYLNDNPRTQADQTQALATFDSAWAWLTSTAACGSSQLGSAGQRCISDRNRGGKFDWFALYRDPIANTPPNASSSALSDVAAATGISSDWLIGGAVLLLAVIL